MRALTAGELLELWERGLSLDPIRRTLSLLAPAYPDETPAELEELSVGARDARLLALREAIFGPSFAALATCPGCGERLELAFATEDVRAEAVAPPPGALELEVAGYRVRFRLPNSEDLRRVAGESEVERARRALLERCFLEGTRNGGAVAPEQLPPRVIEAIVERMGEADPQGAIQLRHVCPACGVPWHARFDVAAFFWSEINTWAHRLLYEVHLLASVYGWREGDILALSPLRRRYYLELAAG